MEAIARYPEFSEPRLEHREEVQRVLSSMDRPISEWTFGNLYVFRRVHDYRLSRWEELLLVVGRGYDGAPYGFAPWGAGPVEQGARLLCSWLEGQGAAPALFPVPKAMAEAHFSGPGWRAEPERDQADYVYLRENLAELPGRKYHKRRNRLAKFLREAAEPPVYVELGNEHVDACIELARGWCDERCSPTRPSTYQETDAVVEALARREPLGLTGGVGLLKGRVAAFCLGEPLGVETYVVHFEKTLPDQEGLAQWISREYCRNALGGYVYVNREQDLGDPGLRRAKESYHPEFLAEKCRVIPRSEQT